MIKHGNEGFTLIEMALVLVLGGLLMSTVLRGQNMIESFRVLRFADDLQNISLSYYSYFNRYNALPGDDANTHGWPQVKPGNSNGRIDGNSLNDGAESHEVWQALRQAGLLLGNPLAAGRDLFPKSPYGGPYDLTHSNFGAQYGIRNCILIRDIAGSVAESVDIRFDDGLYNSGGIRANAAYTNSAVDLYYAI